MKTKLRSRENFLAKKDSVKKQIFEAIRLDNDVRVRKMLRHLSRYDEMCFNKYGERRLTDDEIILAHILKVNELSPRTVYRWFALCKAPQETLELVMQNKISANKVIAICRGIREKEDPDIQKLGKSIIAEVIRVAEGM